MSYTAVRVGDHTVALPLPDLLTILDQFGVDFQRRGETLIFKNVGVLTAELREAVAEHKPALLALCALRSELGRLHEYIIRLRCEDPPKGTRADALHYLAKKIDDLAAMSVGFGGTAEGWNDPADVLADGDQIAMLRSALAELTSGPYPAPLPEGCRLLPEANFDVFADVFGAAGRLYNGMMLG